jgi:hypothetical protein
LVSTAIVAFSKRYTRHLATQSVKEGAPHGSTWTFVAARQGHKTSSVVKECSAAATDPDDYVFPDRALRPDVPPAPFLGERVREMGD